MNKPILMPFDVPAWECGFAAGSAVPADAWAAFKNQGD